MYLDIAYIIEMLGGYLINLEMDHQIVAEQVLWHLQRTKNYMLTYRKSDKLEIIGYLDSDFAGCQNSCRSTSGYVYMLVGGAIAWKSAE